MNLLFFFMFVLMTSYDFSVETHLAMDSCLCDACIRYVDRKANCPSSKPQTSHRKESKSKFEGSMANCSVTACVQPARHSLRKKWYIKIRKSVMKKVLPLLSTRLFSFIPLGVSSLMSFHLHSCSVQLIWNLLINTYPYHYVQNILVTWNILWYVGCANGVCQEATCTI